MEHSTPDETIRAALRKTHARLKRQHELVVEFGVHSLKSNSLDSLINQACTVVAEGMQTPFAKVLTPIEDTNDFLSLIHI